MRTSTLLAALTVVASASAQGPPAGIAPSSNPPSGCQETSKSNFTIGYTLLSSMKRETAIEAGNSALECSLKKGILTDPQGRIGSVVANYQFQFDGPPQAGAIYTGGFSVCPNSSLAIGGTTRWWKCGSGDFYNLYDRSIGGQCDEIRIVVTYEHQTSSSSSAASSKTTSSSASSPTSAAASTTSGASTSRPSNSTASATATSASDSSTASESASSVSTRSAGATSGATGNAASSSGVPPAPAAGAADSIRVPGAEMLGAVIGIFGAALLL